MLKKTTNDNSLSIRWRLQIAFFVVTMFTIVFVRWLDYREIQQVIQLATDAGADNALLQSLQHRLDQYVQKAVVHSALELLALFLVIGWLANKFVNPLKRVTSALDRMRDGDLTDSVPENSHGEIGHLERNLNNVTRNLSDIMRNIDDNAKQMGQSAYQVATISHEIREVSNQEQQRSRQVEDSTVELHDSSKAVVQYAEEARRRVILTEERSKTGVATIETNIDQLEHTVEEVNNAAEAVSRLTSDAEQIFQIVGTIQTIAEQTNLLALNAAIEAARAGDLGRGFAVVADEVRDLATRTTTSTQEISRIINTVKSQIDNVSSLMSAVVDRVHESRKTAQETADIVNEINDSIGESARTNERIHHASQAQLEHFSSLESSLKHLFSTLANNTAKVETTASIGDDLYRVTENLNGMLGAFKFDRIEKIECTENENRSSPRIRNHLRVKVEWAGNTVDTISEDLSMTGMRLRMNEDGAKDTNLSLSIYLPYENLELYKQQAPIEVMAKIVRSFVEDGKKYWGVKFEINDSKTETQLKRCFDFFDKAPYYY